MFKIHCNVLRNSPSFLNSARELQESCSCLGAFSGEIIQLEEGH